MPKSNEELIEDGCRSLYGKTWDGPPEKQPGEAMKRVWRDLVEKAQAPVIEELRQALRTKELKG